MEYLESDERSITSKNSIKKNYILKISIFFGKTVPIENSLTIKTNWLLFSAKWEKKISAPLMKRNKETDPL